MTRLSDLKTPFAAALLTLAVCAARARAQDDKTKSTVALTWYGQSCFLLESPGHTHVLIDPLAASSGFPMPDSVFAELVTVSDQDQEDSNVGLAKGRPVVLEGVSKDGGRWVSFDTKVGDVRVYDVGAYHDRDKGADLGLDSIFVFETGGLRVVHLGNLGHLLTPEQIKKIGRVDVLLVPAGGTSTLDAKRAHQVVGQLRPRYYIIPMHYGTDIAATKDLQPFEEFRKLEDPVTKNVEITHRHTYQVALYNLPKEPKILELEYK